MGRLLFKRSLSAIIAIFGSVTVIFFLSRLIGDPVQLIASPDASPAEREEMRIALGLDRSVIEQYFTFMRDVARGDLGQSLWQSQPALELVLARLPATLLLTAAALGFALSVAMVLGTLAAMRPGSLVDRFANLLSLLGQSVANFWLALMLVLIFSVQVKWLPSAGYGSFSNLILPSVTLGFFSLARLTRLVKLELMGVMRQDYIRTARSKGLPPSIIFLRHALGNIAIPIITLLAVDFGMMMGGAVVTETVFAWPGIGQLMIQAISQRDYPVLQAAAMVIAVVVVLSSFAADIAYALINPRIRYGG